MVQPSPHADNRLPGDVTTSMESLSHSAFSPVPKLMLVYKLLSTAKEYHCNL